jgi:hypothetical protein
VSGTISDVSTQLWKNGNFSFVFQVNPSNPSSQYYWNGAPFSSSQTIQGNLDGTASFSVSVPSNTAITPSGSTWLFQVCPAATATNGCYTIPLTISGTTQSLTSTAVPPAVVVNLTLLAVGATAYTDSEVTGAKTGGQYFNLSDSTIHACSGFPPCTWLSIGTTSSILPNNNTFTGSNSFTQSIIGNLAGNASTATSATSATNATNLVGPGTATGNYTHSGTETFNGNLLCTIFETIRCADQFAGADCGAKINAADASLGAVAGEIWVNTNCGTTWSTAISLSANHVLRLIQMTNFTTSAQIALSTGAGMMCDSPQLQTTPLCTITQANGANLSPIILENGNGNFLRDISILGNRFNNLTGGPCVKVNLAGRTSVESSTIGQCSTFGIWFHSTGSSLQSDAGKIDHSFIGSNNGSGIYADNTGDLWDGFTEHENNGLGATTSVPLVSTTNTTITYVSGGGQTGWSTDSSLLNTMLTVNNAIRCQVLALPTTTTITVSASQCWNITGVATGLGTLTNVPLNWGSGIELSNSPTMRMVHVDLGSNVMNGLLVYGFNFGLGSNEEELSGGSQVAGNFQDAIQIIGYDTVGGAPTSAGNVIVGDVILGGPNQIASSPWSLIHFIDGGGNTVTGNILGSSVTTPMKYGLSVTESSNLRASANYVIGNNVPPQAANFSTAVFSDTSFAGTVGVQIPVRGGGASASLDLFDITAAAPTPHKYIATAGGCFQIKNNAASAAILMACDTGAVTPGSTTFANLATALPNNGYFIFCSDCTIANPCAGSGTGAFAKRLNGVAVCN